MKPCRPPKPLILSSEPAGPTRADETVEPRNLHNPNPELPTGCAEPSG